MPYIITAIIPRSFSARYSLCGLLFTQISLYVSQFILSASCICIYSSVTQRELFFHNGLSKGRIQSQQRWLLTAFCIVCYWGQMYKTAWAHWITRKEQTINFIPCLLICTTGHQRTCTELSRHQSRRCEGFMMTAKRVTFF